MGILRYMSQQAWATGLLSFIHTSISPSKAVIINSYFIRVTKITQTKQGKPTTKTTLMRQWDVIGKHREKEDFMSVVSNIIKIIYHEMNKLFDTLTDIFNVLHP